jgi:hypothetical protein
METHSVLRRIFCIAWIIAGLAFGANPAVAQETNAPAQKTISVAKTEIVPSLIVMNARGASLQGETLTLDGVAPSSIVFADRPVRAAGHMLTTHLLEGWGKGAEGFANDPPNATISVFSKDEATVRDAVVVLKSLGSTVTV